MPEPGWYPDPQDASQFRLWDGGRWTEQTRRRPEGTTMVRRAVASSVIDVPLRRRRRRWPWALVLIGVVGGTGAAFAVSSRSTTGSSGAPPSTGSAVVAAAASAALDCRYADRRPGPLRVVQVLEQHDAHIGVDATPELPAGACRAAAFHDASSHGNLVVAYPTVDAAHRATAPAGTTSVVAGHYRIVLTSPSGHVRYQSELDALVAGLPA